MSDEHARSGSRLPPLLALPAAYAAGTLSAAIFGGGWWLTAAGVVFVALIVRVASRRSLRGPLFLATVLVATVGHARFVAAFSEPPSPLARVTGMHQFVGVLREDATVVGLSAHADLDVEQLDGVRTRGGLRLTVRATHEPLLAGERLRVEGVITPPPIVETFDYAGYLRSRGIDAVSVNPRDWTRIGRVSGGARWRLLALRRWATGNVERSLPEPAAALALGVLLGERRTMPAALTEALRVTGTTHLVVVSGQNVALLLSSAISVLTIAIARRRAAVIALALLPPYLVVVGADPPVVRGAFMALGVAAATVTGRRTPGWVYLLNASAVMLALDPLLARDVAFQLSVSATAGVMLLGRPLGDAALSVLPERVGSIVAPAIELAATATAATLAVTPVQAAAFEQFSAIAIPANIAVAPLYEATVSVALIAGVLGWVEPVANTIWAAGRFVPDAFLATVALCARAPGTALPVRAPLLAGAAWYALLIALGIWLSWREPSGVAVDPAVYPLVVRTLVLTVVTTGVWVAVLAPRDGLARVTVLDVGQGLAVLVQDRQRAVLLDTGPPDDAVMQALTRVNVGRRLDAVLVTHSDSDHSGGLSALTRRLEIGSVLLTARTLAELRTSGTPVDIGDRIHLGARTTIEVLSPPVATTELAQRSTNDGALVLLVTVGDRRILMAADIEALAEHWLVRSGQLLRADALVVPHHGSRTSSTPEFLSAVAPAVAVISLGMPNPYGHPAPEVVMRYEAAGIGLYRTDRDGDVVMSTDGRRLWLRTGHD